MDKSFLGFRDGLWVCEDLYFVFNVLIEFSYGRIMKVFENCEER